MQQLAWKLSTALTFVTVMKLRGVIGCSWCKRLSSLQVTAHPCGVQVSRAAPAALLACSGVCTFVSPWWLVRVQSHRVSIAGPWDIAEVPD